MNKKLKRIVSMLLVVVILFSSGTFSYADGIENGGSFITGEGQMSSGAYLVKNIEVSKNGTSLTNGSCEIADGDELTIQYNLVDLIVNESDDRAMNIANNTSYSFPVPVALNVSESASWDLNYTVEQDVFLLGKVEYQKENNRLLLHVQSDETFKNENIDRIGNCKIAFSVEFDGSQIQNEDINQTLNFGDESDKSFAFTYTDNIKTETTIAKDGSYDAVHDVVNWVVTITQGSKEYEGDLKLIDTFEDNQDYVLGSFAVDGNKIEESTEDNTTKLSYQKDSNELVYTYTPNSPAKKGIIKTITYRTRFNQLAYIGENNTVITTKNFKTTNKAVLVDVASDSKLGDASKTVTTGEESTLKWIEKSSDKVSYDKDTDTQYSTWTLTVDTNGFTFKNLTVIDSARCEPSNTDSKFSVVSDSLKITRENKYNSDLASKYTTNTNDTMTSLGTGHDWNVILEGENQLANGVYTITYQTKITNYSKYILHNQTPATNDAHIIFEWPGYGNGSGKPYGSPTVTQTANNVTKNAMISQSYEAYDTTKHQITWHVILNSSKETDMKDIRVLEKVNGANKVDGDLKQSFVAIKNLKVNGDPASEHNESLVMENGKPAFAQQETNEVTSNETSNSEENIVITFCGQNDNEVSLLNGNKVEFDIITQLTSEEANYYENNIGDTNKRRATNTVQMQLGENNLTAVHAEGNPTVTVLSKSSAGYDYDTHILTWNIEVNKDLVPMNDVWISDVITTGTLDTSSIKVCEGDKTNNESDWVEISDDVTQKYYYSYSNTSTNFDEKRILKVYLNDSANTKSLSKKINIQYQVKIDEKDKINDNGQEKKLNQDNGQIAVSNTAELHKSLSNVVPKVTGTQNIQNDLLKKKVTFDKEEPIAHFEILINQAQAKEMKQSDQSVLLNQLTLIDLMSPGMNLNLPTVKLYKATIKEDGTFSYDKNTLIEKTKYERSVLILGSDNLDNLPAGTTRFEFQLPQDAVSSAYVMTYDATLDEELEQNPTRFTNTISAENLVMGEENTKTDFPKTSLKGWGSGNAVLVSKVSVAVQDDIGQNINGAVIELRYDDQVIARKITNKNGTCTFSHLVPDEEYEIIQVQTPDGYILPEMLDNRKVSFTAEKKATVKETLTNERNTITIQKTNGDTKNPKILEGAVFKISDESDKEVYDVVGNKIQSFTSKATGNQVRGLKNGTYKLIEVSAPNGYVKSAAPYVFTMKNNQMYQGTDDTVEGIVDQNKVSITNKQFHVYFRDEDETGNAFSGAEVALYKQSDVNGSGTLKQDVTAIKTWTTGTELIDLATVMQTENDYVLVQTYAPVGYTKEPNIVIRVNADGSYSASGGTLKKNADDSQYICMTNKTLSIGVTISSALDKTEFLVGTQFEVYESKSAVNGNVTSNAKRITSWTSEAQNDENQHIKQIGNVLSAGESYVLVETKATDRYLKIENTTFTVDNNGSITIVDPKDTLLTGQVIQITNIPLTDIKGTITWVDTNNKFGYRPDNISLKLKKDEVTMAPQPTLSWEKNGNEWKYVFHDLPVCRKDGTSISYVVNSEQTIGDHYVKQSQVDKPYDMTYKMANFPASIQKVNDSGKALENAKLELQQLTLKNGVQQYETIRDWTSTKSAFELFLADGEYRVIETKAPNGYAIADPVNFTVDTNGTVWVNGKDVDGRVIVTDSYTDTEFSKMIVGGSSLKGAELQITDRDGNAVTDIDGVLIPDWISDGTNHVVFGLADGEYVLHEISVPNGFAKAEPIPFAIENGKVKDNDNNRVVMRNKKLSVPFKISAFSSGEAIEGATISIYANEDVNEADIVKSDAVKIVDWISAIGLSEESTHDFGKALKAGQEYCLVETGVPDGYVGAEPIRFAVKDDGTVELLNSEVNDIMSLLQMENMPLADVGGTNIWIDKNNAYKTRPEQVSLQLLVDGEELEEQPDITWSKRKTSSWEYSFGELPEYDDQGNEVVYSVQAENIEQYEVSCESLDVTNDLISGEVKFTALDKVRANVPIKDAVFDFYKQVEEEPNMDKDIVIGEYTTDEKGTIVIEEVPEGKYYFVVDSLPDGYTFTKEPTGMFEMTTDMIQAGQTMTVQAEIEIVAVEQNPIEKLLISTLKKVETGDISYWKYAVMLLIGIGMTISTFWFTRKKDKK